VRFRVSPGWIKFIDEMVGILADMLEEGDILVYASKPLLIAREMVVEERDVDSSEEARRLSERYGLDPPFTELIIRYSQRVLGGVEGVLLTLAGDVFTANAGMDRKNVGLGRVALPPHLLKGVACELRRVIMDRLGVEVGIVISDSVVYPLRLGTRAYAVDICGIKPIKNYVGSRDLYGRVIRFTVLNVADELASAAHLVMGEGDEETPMAVIRGLTEYLGEGDIDMLKIPPSRCLYRDLYPQDLL